MNLLIYLPAHHNVVIGRTRCLGPDDDRAAVGLLLGRSLVCTKGLDHAILQRSVPDKQKPEDLEGR